MLRLEKSCVRATSIPYIFFLFQAMEEVTTIVVDLDILEAEDTIGISEIEVISEFADSRFSFGVGRKIIGPSGISLNYRRPLSKLYSSMALKMALNLSGLL